MPSRWWSSVADAVVRRSFRSGGPPDPDQLAYRRSVVGIGVRVAAVSAGLVAAIVALVVAYVLWQLTPAQRREPPGPTDVHISLDTLDLGIAVAVLGVLSVVLAGIAAWVIARRAVRPLAEAARVQRSFVADASHELRTPLTVLHARVQRLHMATPPEDPRRGVVDELRDDTRVLIDIVNDLLAVAAGSTEPNGDADLGAVLATVHRDMAVVAAGRQVRFEVSPADGTLAVSATQLHRCLVALSDNAIGHSRPGGRVRVAVTRHGPTAVIRVTDEGPGITGIAPTRVFDRFAHGTPTQAPGATAPRTGHGIGLALVRDVAVRAGGDVRVERTGPDGTVFALRLPFARTGTPPDDREDRP
jgi:two-component system OmpR family sensor kinase